MDGATKAYFPIYLTWPLNFTFFILRTVLKYINVLKNWSPGLSYTYIGITFFFRFDTIIYFDTFVLNILNE